VTDIMSPSGPAHGKIPRVRAGIQAQLQAAPNLLELSMEFLLRRRSRPSRSPGSSARDRTRARNDAGPHVAASLRRFGWQQPIVARRSAR